MSLTPEIITHALSAVLDPNTQQDFVSSKALRAVKIEDGDVHLDIELGYPAQSQQETLRQLLTAALADLPGVRQVSVQVHSHIVAHAVQRGIKRLPEVRNILVVASGKGGVGKSTTAVNLALALAAEGARVGILDADIYGPSLPQLLNLSGQLPQVEGKGMKPLEAYGLQAMSIGFIVASDTPMIWRGPLVARALDQLFGDTHWQALDYLVVDMPPGTGDAQLTLSQKVPVTGAVIVTTPQDIALIDARKGFKMFEQVGVPILGVIENMSMHICSNCGHAEPIFGTGGAAKMCADYGTEYLGSLPLDIQIRELADSGKPTVVGAPNSPAATLYRDIARRIAVKIALRPKDMSARFPNIVVKND
ncbi:MAG: iron-sulfur cluster carrier protein ApbC [Zoogloeaceae bacterium]|jgi:ATP-binding protein involved in chromosome partitioning|nr:iron-sulfur cluster carrier protein ApbC [Zoogloeaceae bacterium]